MERVTVRVYLESKPLKKFGACCGLANGKVITLASGELGSQLAKDKAAKAVRDCEWEPLFLDPAGYVLDFGYGWINHPDPEPISAL